MNKKDKMEEEADEVDERLNRAEVALDNAVRNFEAQYTAKAKPTFESDGIAVDEDSILITKGYTIHNLLISKIPALPIRVKGYFEYDTGAIACYLDVKVDGEFIRVKARQVSKTEVLCKEKLLYGVYDPPIEHWRLCWCFEEDI